MFIRSVLSSSVNVQESFHVYFAFFWYYYKWFFIMSTHTHPSFQKFDLHILQHRNKDMDNRLKIGKVNFTFILVGVLWNFQCELLFIEKSFMVNPDFKVGTLLLFVMLCRPYIIILKCSIQDWRQYVVPKLVIWDGNVFWLSAFFEITFLLEYIYTCLMSGKDGYPKWKTNYQVIFHVCWN